MIYNEKYERYIDDDYVVYRTNKEGKLVQCKISVNNRNYYIVITKGRKKTLLHRFIWETFNGPIPDGMEIDHQDTHKENNELSNLKLCTHKENMNNPITLKHLKTSNKGKKLSTLHRNHISSSMVGNSNKTGHSNIYSSFGKKFKAHYGFSYKEDKKLYKREFQWYNTHNKKCRWEE